MSNENNAIHEFDFDDLFNSKARDLDLHESVTGIAGSMENLPFQDEELNLIWSEGAIYFIGFERGLKEWRRLIKPPGSLLPPSGTRLRCIKGTRSITVTCSISGRRFE